MSINLPGFGPKEKEIVEQGNEYSGKVKAAWAGVATLATGGTGITLWLMTEGGQKFLTFAEPTAIAILGLFGVRGK